MTRWIAALLLCVPTLTFAAGSEQTLNTLPTNNASFLTTLQNFLKREDAQRFELQFAGFVVSGGTHSTAASLTAAPTALVAFPGGHYVTENNSITYANNETTWVIAHKDLTGNLSNFVRVSGTHYLIDSTSASKPSLPADSVWLMEVTTSGGSITAVTDLRTRVPETATYLLSELPAAGQRGRTAFVRDVGSGTLYLDNGTAWVQEMSSNPMTTAADMIVGGASGIPTRLPAGTANQVLGMNSGATAQEYKSVVAGSGIGVAHGANSITITQTVFPPTGSIQSYVGTSAPTGWLLCDGTEYDADLYPDLFDLYLANAGDWGRGTALGPFTVNTTTEELTVAGHGRSNGERVHVASTTTLPDPLTANTKYFVINATTDTLQLSTTAGGSAVNITTSGSGTHSIYANLKVPDLRDRHPLGKNVETLGTTITKWPHHLAVTSVGSGSTRTHEGNTTISSNTTISGTHLYTNFTVNAGVTVDVAAGSRSLAIYATDTITINGTITTVSGGPIGGTAGNPGNPGTDQPGGNGNGGANAGGGVLVHGGTLGITAPTSVTASSNPLIMAPFTAVGGGSGAGGSTGTGGRGGGSLILVAPTIVLANTATLNTSGGNGGSANAGGGGAGNVYIIARSFTDNGATFTQTGGSPNGTGGAGSAGIKQINLVNDVNDRPDLVVNYLIKH